MSYDPVSYWNASPELLGGPVVKSPEHERQEEALIKVLKPLYWRSVLEIGVGGGRITNLLHEMRPKSKYTGIDLGQVQLDTGRKIWPEGEFEQVAIEDFDPGDRQWELVITSEVLMHVKPDRIATAVANVLRSARRHAVMVEWDAAPEELERPIAPWNFPHDYRALLGDATIASETRTDRQTIFHVER
jgi:SAM-dependent methyltransferase